MTPEGYSQIRRLFDAALQLDSGQRSQFLDQACAGDAALRKEVETLLAAHEEAGEFLAAPALEVAAKALAVTAGQRPARLTEGSRLGPYRIESPIGAGGMGEVYKARDTRLNRTVAVKVLPQGISHEPKLKQRFEREAQAIAALNHPHICTLYDVGQHEGIDFLVMEYLEGETLAQRIDRGPLPLEQVFKFSIEIADALDKAHQQGVTHRDLKPSNIMLTKSGTKLLDFGLAKLKQDSQAAGSLSALPTNVSLTAEGTLFGTLQYMAPEQLEGKEADGRSDLFAFGAVVYEMATGRKAFEGDSQASLIAAILQKEPPPVSSVQPLAREKLDHLIQRCLAKQPEDRWQTASDVRRELEWAARTGSAAFPAAAAADATPIGYSRRKFAAGCAIAVIVAIVMFWIGRRTSPAPALAPVLASVGFERKTFEPQTIFNARFAPDGQTIVYSSALQDAVPELFVIRPGSLLPQRFGPPRTHLLSVSSKGELAVLTDAHYVLQRLFVGTLSRMTMDGEPRKWLENVREADWSPDGSTLAVVRLLPDNKDQLEYPIGKVLYQTPGYVSDPRVSPDGSRVAFMDHPSKYDDSGWIKVADRSGHVNTLAEFDDGQGLAWGSDADTIYFSKGTSAGVYRVFAVSAKHPSVRETLASAGSVELLDFGATGRSLITPLNTEWSIRALVPGATSEREFPWLNSAITPFLSRDGSLMIFSDVSESAGRISAVAMRRTDGSPAVRLGEGQSVGLSPDGQWVVAETSSKPARLAAYPTGVGDSIKFNSEGIEAYTSGLFMGGSWFPDSRRFLACGNEQARRPRCYVHDLGGGPPKPVTPEGTTAAIPSPDGKSIAAVFADRTVKVWRLDGGEPRLVPGLNSDQDTLIGWSDSGNALFVQSGHSGSARLERVDAQSGARTLVRTVAPPDHAGLNAVFVTSVRDDGRYYAYWYRKQLTTLFVVTGMR